MDNSIFIDKFGYIVSEEKSTHKVMLSGAYSWSYLFGAFWYDIKKIEPQIPLTRILSSEMLLENIN